MGQQCSDGRSAVVCGPKPLLTEPTKKQPSGHFAFRVKLNSGPFPRYTEYTISELPPISLIPVLPQLIVHVVWQQPGGANFRGTILTSAAGQRGAMGQGVLPFYFFSRSRKSTIHTWASLCSQPFLRNPVKRGGGHTLRYCNPTFGWILVS